ncbi:MAG TPA: DUF6519 domain-containing protein, partial [Longimicrobiales bacterium]|nr:DUF6519 domain-containing protein [Longimicrobiales bacterium]
NATPDCAAVIAAWRAALANIATLTARTVIPPPTSGPCVLPDTAGFRGLENQLYRVEVHTGGDTRAQARFKWSRVNASIETGITAFATAAVTVRDLGRDDILGFRDGQWAEIVDDHSELLAQSGQLVQLGPVNPDTNTISIRSSTPFTPVPLNRHPKLRRWDQSGSAATTAGVSATQFPSSTEFGFALEDGIEVVLSEGRYRAGDYWLIPARTAVTSDTGDIEWPLNGGGNRLPLPPHGIEHRLAPLALLNFNGTTFSAPPSSDCRTIFPPLTDIDAADVGFDNTNCQLANANTVQQAIDALCARHEECCSLVVTPGPQWTDALAPLADEAVVHICFRPGEYRLNAPLVFRDKTAVRISGCGPGTRIVCPTSESALVLERCASVTIRDLHVEAGLVGTQRPDLEHLNGALTCIDCSSVTVEHASFACSNGAIRAAACLVVRNAPPRDLGSSARVTGCTLDIGYNQLGLLVLGAARSAIEGNHVLGRVVSQPNWDVLLEDPDLRARLRHEILHHAALSAVAGSGRAQVTFAGQAVSFLTAPTLVAAWQKLVTAAPPATISSAADLLRQVKRLAVRVLRDPVLRAQVPEFGAWLNSMRAATPAIAGQGIVVGGGLSEEARILNNSITGVQEGVHLGLSTAAAQPGPARSFGALVIQGNRIDVNVVAGGLRDYGGIFVGNSRSTVIESNTLQLTRFPFSSKPLVFGMRIHGELGRMLAVRQNLMTA